MLKENDIELRSEEFQEVLGSVPSWILRWGITIIALIIAILLTGSAIIKYPDIIPAQIVLTGSTPPAAIVSHTSGKIEQLYVRDNQEVKSGDYLAVIDNPALTGNIITLKNYLKHLTLSNDTFLLPDKNLQLGSLQQLFSTFYSTLFEYAEYRRLLYYPKKKTILQERIAQYRLQSNSLLNRQRITDKQFFLTQKQYRRDSILNVKGVISNEELEKSENTYLQSLLSSENMRSNLNNMQIQIGQLEESLLDTEQQDVEKLNELRTQLQSLLSQLNTGIQEWELNYVLRAPIAGKIAFTRYWIENQNVLSGSEIFTIVPENKSSIIGKAMLPIARSGKVETGQKVNIRLKNFPENEYGILKGVVQNISLVPIQQDEAAYYILEIVLPDKLQTTYKKELPYLPNMQGQAGIITDDISLLERLVLPLKKILKESI
ncbi:MAG: HlyD family secretion protein [Dysgonamonadaceae bacterium]|jgi:HlyD family secretion protein|nr:HlyD family secretion protein [Dysgonamonadaceae bacterium]